MDAKDIEISIQDLIALNQCAVATYQGILCIRDADILSDVVDKVNEYREEYVLEYTKRIDDLLKNPLTSGLFVTHKQFDEIMGYKDNMMDYLNRLNLHVAKLVSESNRKVIQRSREGLVNQLSIFSIVLAVLSFLLNNAKLLSFETLSFPLLMAGNVSFILMCSVLFALIYYFLHLDEGINNGIPKIFLLIVTIVVLSGLIYDLVCLNERQQQKHSGIEVFAEEDTIDSPTPLPSSSTIPEETLEQIQSIP